MTNDNKSVRNHIDDVVNSSLNNKPPSTAQRNLSNPTAPLYKIVLTGGPCGGKTTSLARLSSFLRERGFEVMTVPEAFSLLVSNGMSLEYFLVDGFEPVVQGSVMDVQRHLEDAFEKVLRSTGKPGVLLCDRGLMDGAAYCSREQWDTVLASRDVSSICDIREGRYHAVFHLVTAAEGAEAYYTLENNLVRTETPEVARKLDKLTREAWVGHPRLHVLDNSTDFEGKLQRMVATTAKLVGLPSTLSRVTTKYLLRQAPDISLFPADVQFRIFEVEKVYLYSKSATSNYAEEYSFIRKRQQGKGEVYGQTTVKLTHDGQEIEVKRIISRREYTSLFNTRDLKRHVVRQTRISFLYHMQSFNIHFYREPEKVCDLCILHCQFDASGGAAAATLPPFLDIDRQLTSDDNAQYGAFRISVIDEN